MREINELYHHAWWRYSDYTVVNNTIRPAPNATLTSYDPWLTGGEATVRLTGLVSECADWTFPAALPARCTKRLIKWCRDYGLLGILQHRVSLVEFARPSVTFEVKGRVAGLLSVGGVLSASFPATFYNRTGSAWWSKSEEARDFERVDAIVVDIGKGPEGTHSLLDAGCKKISVSVRKARNAGVPAKLSHPVDLGGGLMWAEGTVPDIGSRWHGEPRVGRALVSSLGSDQQETQWEPLDRTFGRFFPDIPASATCAESYALPNTPEFWAAYGEPVEEFLDAARLFKLALQSIGGGRGANRRSPVSTRHLESLLSEYSVGLDYAKGRFEMKWRSPSLLGALALTAAMDATRDNNQFRFCSVCGGMFPVTSYQKKYCGVSCRGTARKRTQRKAKPRRRLG